jgi:murein DD-endopeptidase MepM/ murein hydrolase activator NlpD
MQVPLTAVAVALVANAIFTTKAAGARPIDLWPADRPAWVLPAPHPSARFEAAFDDLVLKMDLDTLPIAQAVAQADDVEDDPCDPYFGRVLKLRANEDSNHPLRAWFPVAEPVKNGHRDKVGNWVDYEVVPRRLERPEYYAAYVYPVAQEGAWGLVASGFDLDVVNDDQRRGKMKAVGHGGVDLPQVRGAPVRMLPLEAQVGDARVVFVGQLMGNTVITQHTLREGTGSRHYLAIFGHLDEAASELYVGKRLRRRDLVGYVGNSDSPDFVHLHYEIRRLHDAVDPLSIEPARLVSQDASIPVDPRNVLPLRRPVARARIRHCSNVYSQLRVGWAEEWAVRPVPFDW